MSIIGGEIKEYRTVTTYEKEEFDRQLKILHIGIDKAIVALEDDKPVTAYRLLKNLTK